LLYETEEQLKRIAAKLKRELGSVIVAALENPETLEVCVNSDGHIWVEEKTKRLYDTGKWIAPENLLAALGTIAARSGIELNESTPILESRLPLDGSRVEGAIPPVTPDGPSIAIRKHASAIWPLRRYVEEKRISAEAADYLRDAIRGAKNILVAGGTSSGKTTFINALIQELLTIAPRDRLLVIEDELELQCATDNKERFVTSKNVSMRTLIKTAMRYRPDRIIIGEVRDGAALDLLKSWNTGHPGGFATIHSNDALSALTRLEQLILEAAQSPMSSLIAEAVNIVVYMREFGRVGRQVTEIIWVTGYKGGEYQYRQIYESGARDSGKE
jgi:type IV secretion system protein VirB11